MKNIILSTKKYNLKFKMIKKLSWLKKILHVSVDDMVDYKHGEKSAQTLRSTGFQNMTFRTYNG